MPGLFEGDLREKTENRSAENIAVNRRRLLDKDGTENIIDLYKMTVTGNAGASDREGDHQMSRVSVIIPVYNVEKYLPACLDSVLNQTLRDLEVIAIDDCSPDRCGEILDDYAARDSRITVIHLPENHRQGYGRNRGLERAAGTYCYFLDSDDTVSPEALEELADLADREELDEIFFDSTVMYESEDLKKVYNPPFNLRKGTYPQEAVPGAEMMELFFHQGEWTSYPQRIFWRRKFLMREGIRFPEGSEHEDEFFLFAGTLAAQRARYVRRQYFNLRIRPNSVMTTPIGPKNFHGYLVNFYLMNRFAAERGMDTEGIRIYTYRMWEMVLILYNQLKDRYDLGGWFRSERDRMLWYTLRNYVSAEYYGAGQSPEVFEKLRKAGTVYIYGTGSMATRFCNRLQYRESVPIAGFLTKDPENEPRVLMGRPVLGLDGTEIPDDAVVAVAVWETEWFEIRKELESRGISCTYYRTL